MTSDSRASKALQVKISDYTCLYQNIFFNTDIYLQTCYVKIKECCLFRNCDLICPLFLGKARVWRERSRAVGQ